MKVALITAGIFLLVALLVWWKLPALIIGAFLIAMPLLGFFIGKKNSNVIDKFK